MTEHRPDELPECDVLRCTVTMDGLLTHISGRCHKEFRVCDNHGRRIADGEEYRLDRQQRVLLIGQDLAGLHQWQVSAMNVNYDGDSPDARMALKTKRLGTEDIDEVVVHLSGNNRRLLAQFPDPGRQRRRRQRWQRPVLPASRPGVGSRRSRMVL